MKTAIMVNGISKEEGALAKKLVEGINNDPDLE